MIQVEVWGSPWGLVTTRRVLGIGQRIRPPLTLAAKPFCFVKNAPGCHLVPGIGYPKTFRPLADRRGLVLWPGHATSQEILSILIAVLVAHYWRGLWLSLLLSSAWGLDTPDLIFLFARGVIVSPSPTRIGIKSIVYKCIYLSRGKSGFSGSKILKFSSTLAISAGSVTSPRISLKSFITVKWALVRKVQNSGV